MPEATRRGSGTIHRRLSHTEATRRGSGTPHRRLSHTEEEISSESSDGMFENESKCKLIKRITRSPNFSLGVAVMITLNVLVMGFQANYEDLYFPASCWHECVSFRQALKDKLLEMKDDQGAAGGGGNRRLAGAILRRRHLLEEADTDGDEGLTVRIHTLDVDGFPMSTEDGSSAESSLDGPYRELLEPEYSIGNRSTFWDFSGQRYIFYCRHSRSWGIGALGDWARNREGECVRVACTASGVDILDPAEARFTKLRGSQGWTAISGARVAAVRVKEVTPGVSLSSAAMPAATPWPLDELVENATTGIDHANFAVSRAVSKLAFERGCTNVWHVINTSFLMFFAMELSFRAITVGARNFFRSEDKNWNIFDTTVVLLGVMSLIMRNVLEGNGSSKFVTMIRVVRILRILRVLRIFREFKQLNVLIRGLLQSFNIVFWICSLMMLFVVVYAILCTEYIGRCAEEYNDADEIKMYFGSIANSTTTLFQILTLDDWSSITRLVWEKRPFMCPLLLFFVVGMSLVVVSLLTGVMAEHMNTVRESEEALEELERQEKLRTDTQIIYDAFHRSDGDDDKTINFEEFQQLLRDDLMLAELNSIELDLSKFDSNELFICFDRDCDGKLTWSEFKEGLEELRQPVGSKQLFKLQFNLQRLVTVQKGASSLQPKSPNSSSLWTMTSSVEQQIEQAAVKVSSIEETMSNFEDELQGFLAELRKSRPSQRKRSRHLSNAGLSSLSRASSDKSI